MLEQLKTRQSYIWPLLMLVAANGVIVANGPPALRYAAAVILLAFLPGWLWLEFFFDTPTELFERLTLAVGLSLALTIFGAMLAVYLPGPISLLKLLLIANSITLVGLAGKWYRSRPPTQSPNLQSPISNYQLPNSKLIILIIALMLLAAALRLPRLGYAEFHEDEAEALMLGVRLLQGEDYALFLHRKGPAQMLVPVAFWLLTGRITETLARFPFALSSIFSVAALFFIGRRWFGWQAGAVAALLWTVNGYAIAFGRMVQYQALIFFLGPLAIYCLYSAHKLAQPRLQIVAALLLAASLLAHFDALLLLPAAAYFIWLILKSSQEIKGARERGRGGEELAPQHPSTPAPQHQKLLMVLLAAILFIVLLASFYVPFVLDPQFQNTADYLAGTRVKPGLLYNNLDLLRRLDRDYSSHFYLPLLALGLVGFMLLQGSRVTGSKVSSFRFQVSGHRSQVSRSTSHVPRPTLPSSLLPLLFFFLLTLLSASSFWLPNLWQLDSLNLAIIPWLLLLGLLFWRSDRLETRAAWLLFGAPLIGYGFLVDDPRTHLYILYPGAALLAGAGLSYFGYFDFAQHRFWILRLRSAQVYDLRLPSKFAIHNSQFTIRTLASGVGLCLVALIVTYQVAIFLPTESTFTRLREQWDGSLWETAYDDIPTAREYFGYPKREGWKAIGALRAQGHFPGDFRSVNEDFIVPIWYNYGQARSCYNTPAQFFVRTRDVNPAEIINEGYRKSGQIEREGEIRLQIFSAGQESPKPVKTFMLQNFTGPFDRLATPHQFARQSQPARPLETQFGPAIQFLGYTLPTPTVAPGDTLRVNLYWLALESPRKRYRAFAHLTDGTTLWGQQDDDPACRLPTSIWRPGQRGVGQFRLPISPDTPPGRYPLIIGLYQADTLERLNITAGAGQPGDDFLWLTDIEVVSAD